MLPVRRRSFASARPLGTPLTLDPRTGAFVYLPNKNVFGLDLFAFRVSDGSAASNVAWVAVSVEK